MKKKAFDCVEMKRRGAERIYAETKDMTHEEKLAYWQQRNKEFHEEIDRLKKEAIAKRAERSK